MLDIVTVTKNDLSGFRRTIKTTQLLREKYGVRQIIVDGSTGIDKQKNVEFIKELKNVDYYWQKPSGIANAFNFGLSKSKAKWVWFLNGGDEVYKKIDNDLLLQILKKASSDIIIFEVQEEGREIKHPPLHLLWPPLLNWVPHQATFVKQDVFRKFGNFRNNYHIAMDGDLWLRLFSRYDVKVDLISIPIAVSFPGGIHSNVHFVAQETLKSIWENREVLIRRSLNRIYMFFRAIHFYISKSLGF